MPVEPWFGTDGIRGPANVFPLIPAVAQALGETLVAMARSRDGVATPLIAIGRDTRSSGSMLAEATAAGVAAAGGKVVHYGVLPTPGVVRLALLDRAHFMIVVSASHNPHDDNGLKVVGPDGFKLAPEQEGELELAVRDVLRRGSRALLAELDPSPVVSPATERFPGPARAPGEIATSPVAAERFVATALEALPERPDLNGLTVALDCANGAAFETGPALLRALGADVRPTCVAPDGRNINLGCGATKPGCIVEHTLAEGAAVGIALDGDADRVILVDERGGVIDGDHLMTLLALDLAARGRLSKRAVVATVMSNMGMELALAQAGIDLLRTDVGDRHVVDVMRRGGYLLGGEQSGHIILLDRSTTGDGILAALAALEVMARTGRKLSELAGVMTRLPQVLVNVEVARKCPFDDLPEVRRAASAVERELSGEGRVLLRYSGTESLARVMLEGPNKDRLTEMAAHIADAIRAEQG